MVFEIDAEAGGRIAGWIVDGDEPVVLEVRLDGMGAGEIVASEARPDLVAAGTHPTGACGFSITEMDVPGLRAAETVEIRTGELVIYRVRRQAQLARERLFLMHIPKTGGTSLNHVLSPLFQNAYTHLEGRAAAELHSILSLAAPRSLFLSGHLLFNGVAPVLLAQPTRLATLLRDPADQLISHLAWTYRIAQEPAHLALHHPVIQEVAMRVAAIDPDDAATFAHWIDTFTPTDRQLFFNLQTRYLGADDPNVAACAANLDRARETLRRFDVVGRLERIELFARRLDRMLGVDLGPIPRMRVNPDVERFRPLLRFTDLVRPLTELDEVLYADVVAGESLAGRLRQTWRRGAPEG